MFQSGKVLWSKEKKEMEAGGIHTERIFEYIRGSGAISFIPFSHIYAQDVISLWCVSVITAHLRGLLVIPALKGMKFKRYSVGG